MVLIPPVVSFPILYRSAAGAKPPTSHQTPPLPILPPDDRICLRTALGDEVLGVPLNLLAQAIRDVAQVVGLGQPAGVLEVRAGRLARLAGVNPLGVVPGRRRDKRLRRL